MLRNIFIRCAHILKISHETRRQIHQVFETQLMCICMCTACENTCERPQVWEPKGSKQRQRKETNWAPVKQGRIFNPKGNVFACMFWVFLWWLYWMLALHPYVFRHIDMVMLTKLSAGMENKKVFALNTVFLLMPDERVGWSPGICPQSRFVSRRLAQNRKHVQSVNTNVCSSHLMKMVWLNCWRFKKEN